MELLAPLQYLMASSYYVAPLQTETKKFSLLIFLGLFPLQWQHKNPMFVSR